MRVELWVLFSLLLNKVYMFFFSFVSIQFFFPRLLGSIIVFVVVIDAFIDCLLISMSLVLQCYFCNCCVIFFWLRCCFLSWFIVCDVGVRFVGFFRGLELLLFGFYCFVFYCEDTSFYLENNVC